MSSGRIALTATVLVLMSACVESNPQPSPGQDSDTRYWDRLDALEADATAGLHDQVPEMDDASAEADLSGEELDSEADGGDTIDVQRPEDITEPFDVGLPDPCPLDLCPAGPEYAPDPSTTGPYPVGAMTFPVTLLDQNGNPRTIRIEVWYPTTEEHRNGPFDAIDFVQDAPESVKDLVQVYEGQLPSIPVDVVRNAPLRRADGPYPLVVFSHGAYGIRFQSVFFTVPLASHGYVVASADHTGNILYDLLGDGSYNVDSMIVSAFDRPLDAVAVIDEMIRKSSDITDPLYLAVDDQGVGISGHSFGGYTSLNLGFTDSRIKAVLPMAPATFPLGLLGFKLAEFPHPMMMMTGGLDKTLKTQDEMAKPFLDFPSPKFYFELKTGGHFTYSDICMLDLLYIANDLGIPDADNALNDGCADFNLDTDIAHPIIRQFGIGFFNYYLRQSPGSLQWFSADAAEPLADNLTYTFQP
jgi:predicted dienelactone hydrolase